MIAQASNAPNSGGLEAEEVFELSPFEVVADTTGYFQANSMSGTRLNSKVEDLAQSITVMTTEQMSDFAMVDINDVFDHMASTEGTSSYSLFETDRTGAVVDQVSLDPNNSNRVRGIGNANIAFNNIGMTGRVPVDPLWLDSLELSRGPNANIFGLGNASGTVNQVPATANLNYEFIKTQLRVDSDDGHRASVDINRHLSDDVAVRLSFAKQHTGFVRKPSGEDAQRLSLQLKARPFENTTVAVSWYNYENESVRPNFTTPRDYYTDWVDAGMPGWNPITRLVTLRDGTIVGNGVDSSGNPRPYTGTPSFFAGPENRSVFRIAPDTDPYWAIGRYVAGTDPFAGANSGVGLLNTNSSDSYTASQQPLFNSVVRPIDDKSIYDWTEINLAGNSKAWDDTNIYMAQIDQFILNNTKQTLAFQGTFMREDVNRLENQPMGPASVNSNVGQLQVDVNMVNLDGSPNPYFGRPYLRSNEPYLRDKSQMWDTSRAQGVYRINFADDDGWTKWLGTQQVVGYYEYKDRQDRQYSYRHSALSLDAAWQQKYANLNTPLGNRTQTNVQDIYPIAPGNYARINEQYYVGSTPYGGIEYAPAYFPEGATLPFVWGASASSMNYDVSPIGFTPSPDGGGGGANKQSVIKTTGGVLQSTFFDGRLIGTFGTREDTVYDRNAPFATLTSDLREYDFAASNQWNEGWREAGGKTTNISLVARPFRDIDFLKSKAEGGSGFSKLFGEAISSMSLTYNEADNFIAQGPAYDLFLNPLPNQTGTTTDKGFWMSMMEGKLSLRYVHYTTKQLDLRNGDVSTLAQRIMRMDGLVANDRQSLMRHAKGWLGYSDNETPPDNVLAAALQMPVDQFSGLKELVANNTYAAVNNLTSTGDELEINYNPNRYWTVSASVTKNQSINTAAGSAVDDYYAARVPVWTTIEDPRFTRTTYTPVDILSTTDIDESAGGPIALQGDYSQLPVGPTGHLLYWNIVGQEFRDLVNYDSSQSPEVRFQSNVDAPMSVFRALVGRPRPQIREYTAKFNTKYRLAGISEDTFLKDMSVGGSVRWADKASIGFYGLGYDPAKDLRLPENKILELDTNRPIYSPAETYVDLFVSYKTKLFDEKVDANFQLNVKNAFENGGGLQATSAFLDGTSSTYRIIDPRQFILSASFDL
ncbi:hypothetical protein IEN85_23630 [Pelagicoccus sp. NFK12]|uniref:TonB-dependent receptor n=1 Tax=Pelagicoccus enzymogenes TaxID=2773457 RepID=A0A927FF21_9BACT|nr:hypothetical protein [Pelagicoccus enzymogenes]MBD5782510.1 hypothetical protein [Pelagicoccus enzymogenes]